LCAFWTIGLDEQHKALSNYFNTTVPKIFHYSDEECRLAYYQYRALVTPDEYPLDISSGLALPRIPLPTFFPAYKLYLQEQYHQFLVFPSISSSLTIHVSLVAPLHDMWLLDLQKKLFPYSKTVWVVLRFINRICINPPCASNGVNITICFLLKYWVVFKQCASNLRLPGLWFSIIKFQLFIWNKMTEKICTYTFECSLTHFFIIHHVSKSTLYIIHQKTVHWKTKVQSRWKAVIFCANSIKSKHWQEIGISVLLFWRAVLRKKIICI
jgi:hypothetical protein